MTEAGGEAPGDMAAATTMSGPGVMAMPARAGCSAIRRHVEKEAKNIIAKAMPNVA